jgi:deoxyribonuclease IV
MPILGAHISVAGGVSRAFARGADIGCDALQIFVKNNNRWQGAPLGEGEVRAYFEARATAAGPNLPAPLPVVAHAGYLINLCSTKPEVHSQSRSSLLEELTRCDALAIPGLVMHPGAHLGAGVEVGIDEIARGLDAVHAARPTGAARVLLENTAGQGTVLGGRLADLAAIRARLDAPERVGVCIDTCHAFAAGYDLAGAAGYEAFMAELEGAVGIAQVGALHLNDSAFGCGKRKDRHATIGEGELGLETFARILHDPRWRDVPMILETPLGEDEQGHARDLVTLRGLL